MVSATDYNVWHLMSAQEKTKAAVPAQLSLANQADFGLLPGCRFFLSNGQRTDSTVAPQAIWFFRDECIALPLPGQPIAGFSAKRRVYDDLAHWHTATPAGSVLDAPPLIWAGARYFVKGARINPGATALHIGTATIPMGLIARHPLNRSYFDASSAEFLGKRTLHVRGHWEEGQLNASSLWPEDFRLPALPVMKATPPSPAAIRELIRNVPQRGAKARFSTTMLWQKSKQPLVSGQPVIAFMLNGAQGDDDEAHAGHFALVTGRIGDEGAINDWLVSNYYTLDSESEKGIIAAPVPLDNYLADLNAGQAWYRPSYMLVAVLRDARTAVHLQSALGRVFNHFYGHRFCYQHARNNCTGISISTLRSLGWEIPARGPESWLRAIISLPAVSIASRSLKKGKAAFDYLTEDQTRLYPAAAFEEIGADLLRMTAGTAGRQISEFEQMLADDIEALIFVHIPQLPSSRAWGREPVLNSAEYRKRLPKNPAEQQTIPVAPRPFPAHLIDPDAPGEPLLRSDYALAGYALAFLLLLMLLIR